MTLILALTLAATLPPARLPQELGGEVTLS